MMWLNLFQNVNVSSIGSNRNHVFRINDEFDGDGDDQDDQFGVDAPEDQDYDQFNNQNDRSHQRRPPNRDDNGSNNSFKNQKQFV